MFHLRDVEMAHILRAFERIDGWKLCQTVQRRACSTIRSKIIRLMLGVCVGEHVVRTRGLNFVDPHWWSRKHTMHKQGEADTEHQNIEAADS